MLVKKNCVKLFKSLVIYCGPMEDLCLMQVFSSISPKLAPLTIFFAMLIFYARLYCLCTQDCNMIPLIFAASEALLQVITFSYHGRAGQIMDLTCWFIVMFRSFMVLLPVSSVADLLQNCLISTSGISSLTK